MTEVEVREIPNPELLLPDDKLPPAMIYRAVSSFIGRDYMSLQSLLRQRAKTEHHLALQMSDVQRAIAAPTWVMYAVSSAERRMEVFGEIPTPNQVLDLAPSGQVVAQRSTSAGRRLIKRMENAHMRGWLYGCWYSKSEPNGSWGVMHRCFIQAVLEESVFKSIKANGWESK